MEKGLFSAVILDFVIFLGGFVRIPINDKFQDSSFCIWISLDRVLTGCKSLDVCYAEVSLQRRGALLVGECMIIFTLS